MVSREEIEFEKWSDEKFCLKAVERNGDALQYVSKKEIFLRILKS